MKRYSTSRKGKSQPQQILFYIQVIGKILKFDISSIDISNDADQQSAVGGSMHWCNLFEK